MLGSRIACSSDFFTDIEELLKCLGTFLPEVFGVVFAVVFGVVGRVFAKLPGFGLSTDIARAGGLYTRYLKVGYIVWVLDSLSSRGLDIY